jgi:hypothetical protein
VDRAGALKTARADTPRRYICAVEENAELSELAHDVPQLRARLEHGERIAVTEDGELLGYLVPPGRSHLAPADAAGSPFERLVAAGQVRRATGHGIRDLLPIPAAEPGEESPVDELLRMRDEERY